MPRLCPIYHTRASHDSARAHVCYSTIAPSQSVASPPTNTSVARPLSAHPTKPELCAFEQKSSTATVHSTLGSNHGDVGDAALGDLHRLQAKNIARSNSHEVNHVGQVDDARLNEVRKHQAKACLEARHAKGRELEFASLLPCSMRRMVGDDSVDRAIFDALDKSGGIGGGTQRRVHLQVGFIGIGQRIFGKEEVMPA